MTASLVPFRAPERKPVEGVVRLLERLLEQAKAGKVRGVACVSHVLREDGDVPYWSWRNGYAHDGTMEVDAGLLAGLAVMDVQFAHDVLGRCADTGPIAT
jgi:hypothetical protein